MITATQLHLRLRKLESEVADLKAWLSALGKDSAVSDPPEPEPVRPEYRIHFIRIKPKSRRATVN